jgi:hypothetical protein
MLLEVRHTPLHAVLAGEGRARHMTTHIERHITPPSRCHPLLVQVEACMGE